VQASVAAQGAASWVAQLAGKDGLSIVTSDFLDYELHVVVTGETEGLERFAEKVLDYGLELFEKGELNWLEVSAVTLEGQVWFKGVADYQTGVSAYYEAPEFKSQR
jgi:hypothetical protein